VTLRRFLAKVRVRVGAPGAQRASEHRAQRRAHGRSLGVRYAHPLMAGSLALALGGCGEPAAPTAGPARRIVVLAPSATETVFALGAGDRVVGVCGQCDYPADAAARPKVGGYLTPSVESVLGARPDLVIAVPSPGNREAVRAIERAGVRVLVVQDRQLADLWSSIETIAGALDIPADGARLSTDLRAALDAVRARVAGRPRARVLLVVGHSPLIVAGGGTLQGELLDVAGGDNVAGDVGSAWPQVSPELVVARAPDVILDAAMGTEAGARDLFAGLTTVPAVANGRIEAVSSDAIFRAGPRVAEGAVLLADAIHPMTRPPAPAPPR
jgi:iron complex transport system substrate-binding protein